MVRKSYSEEDILRLLRVTEVDMSGGTDLISAYRAAGLSDKTYNA